MRPPTDRAEKRKGFTRFGVVFASTWVIGSVIAMLVGFSMALSECKGALDSFSGVNVDLSGFDKMLHRPVANPIPIPHSACPSLRLVSVAAHEANEPWRRLFQDPAVLTQDWTQFSQALSTPLASLDGALGAAVDHVPGPVASDLREVRRRVEVGRLELTTPHTVNDYMNNSGVLDGYTALLHASDLVGNACGFVLAPPLPF
jgi:hypothetical protein